MSDLTWCDFDFDPSRSPETARGGQRLDKDIRAFGPHKERSGQAWEGSIESRTGVVMPSKFDRVLEWFRMLTNFEYSSSIIFENDGSSEYSYLNAFEKRDFLKI